MAGLLQSGRVHQIAGPSDFGDFLASPAVNRAINALFDDDVSLWSQDTAAAGSPPQNQAFNPASLMQAMLPSGNQVQSSLLSKPEQMRLTPKYTMHREDQ